MSDSLPRTIRIATRASRLALWQAGHIAALLRGAFPGTSVELVEVATTGDRDQTGALSSFGGVGVFTREVQKAVLDGRADIAVHSLKDLPSESAAGLNLAAVPPREETADALVLPLSAAQVPNRVLLPMHARVGTGSLRRRAQLWHIRRDLKMLEVRGNVETRLRKLDAGEYDSLILAVAGLKRLDLAARVTREFAPSEMYPAVGQGALGIECREEDAEARRVLAQIDDPAARSRVTAERALMAHLRAGCHAPVGAATRIESGELALEAVVLSPNGRERVVASGRAAAAAAETLGRDVGQQLIGQGADRLLGRS